MLRGLPIGILGQVWYFIVSIPDLCTLTDCVVTCWEKADLLALLYMMCSCIFSTFQYCVLDQVWNLTVSVPGCCLLPYFVTLSSISALIESVRIYHNMPIV